MNISGGTSVILLASQHLPQLIAVTGRRRRSHREGSRHERVVERVHVSLGERAVTGVIANVAADTVAAAAAAAADAVMTIYFGTGRGSLHEEVRYWRVFLRAPSFPREMLFVVI